MSALFDVWTLDDLVGDEYKEVVKRLAVSQDSSNAIIEQIEATGHDKSSLCGLLCTPLLVTLLILTYKFYKKIPQHLSEFYESIFFVLLQRHDGTKPGFTRLRSCSINDTQYRDLFDALCYQTKTINKLSFTRKDISTLVQKSM